MDTEKTKIDIDKLEQISRIFSMLVIPVVLTVIGWRVQTSLTKSSVNQEYVKLAVSILSSPRSKDVDILRPWAVELFKLYAPVSLTKEQYNKLKSGEIRLVSLLETLPKEVVKPVFPEEAARKMIMEFLHNGKVEEASKLLDYLRGKVKEEEAKHIFDYCIKNNLLKEALEMWSYLSKEDQNKAIRELIRLSLKNQKLL